MEFKDSLKIIKALGDTSRLMIINSLLEKPQYVEEISKRLNLASSTVSFHLKKLEEANLVEKIKEQYYIIYNINEELFNISLKELILFDNFEKLHQEERIKKYKQKVIDTFFENGKLKSIPVQHKKRWIILEKFIERFQNNRIYKEQEVNNLINELFDDYVTIRRYLVDENILTRKNNEYKLNPEYEKINKQYDSLKKSFENSINDKF